MPTYLKCDDVPVKASNLRHMDGIGNIVKNERVDVVIPKYNLEYKDLMSINCYHFRTSKIVFSPVFKLLLNSPCLI